VTSRRLSHTSDSSHSSSSPRENSAPSLYPAHHSLPPNGTSRIPNPSNKSPKSSRLASSRLPLAVKSSTSHEMTLRISCMRRAKSASCMSTTVHSRYRTPPRGNCQYIPTRIACHPDSIINAVDGHEPKSGSFAALKNMWNYMA